MDCHLHNYKMHHVNLRNNMVYTQNQNKCMNNREFANSEFPLFALGNICSRRLCSTIQGFGLLWILGLTRDSKCHLCCVLDDQLLACKLIVKDGRPIPAVPSLTSNLIIHPDNRQSGAVGSDSLGPDQDYIYNSRHAGRQRHTHLNNSSDSVTLERYSFEFIHQIEPPCHR